VHTLDTLKKVYPPTLRHVPDLLTRGPYVGGATAAGANHANVSSRNYHAFARHMESQPPRKLLRMRRPIAPLHCATPEYKTTRVAGEMSVDARRCGHPYVVLGDTCLTGFVLCHTVFRWATSGWALCILVFIAVQIFYSHVRSPACLVRRIL